MEYKYTVLTNTTIGAFMSQLDGNIVLIALPTITRKLNATAFEALWVLMGYILMTAVLPIGRHVRKGASLQPRIPHFHSRLRALQSRFHRDNSGFLPSCPGSRRRAHLGQQRCHSDRRVSSQRAGTRDRGQPCSRYQRIRNRPDTWRGPDCGFG